LKVFHSPGEDSSRVARSISAMAHEARVLAPLNHPNIIRCYGIVELDSSTIVLELADSGKLTDRLQASPLISITDAYTYAQQIAYGMVYLHEQGIVHCDLKGSNVLLSAQDQIKISDFGVSVAVDSTVADHGYTELWAAPGKFLFAQKYVLATNDERRNIRRTTSYDVYSFAMVLYEIVTRGKLPFSLNTPRVANVATALKNRLRPVRPESDLCILSIWVLMNSCWAQDPNGRPSFQTIIESLKS
ncbi:kinase-like domain-containing protein, partial [Cladochytrium replicatum]